MSACERYEADLSALLDGELDPAKEEELRAHMAGCPECRAIYEAFSLLHSEAQEPPAGLAAGIMAAVHAEAAGSVTQMPKPKSRWKPWLAAAASVAVIVGVISIPRLLSQKPSLPNDTVVRSIPPTEESAPPETAPITPPAEEDTVSPAPDDTAEGTGGTESKTSGAPAGGYTPRPAPAPAPAPTQTPVPAPVTPPEVPEETQQPVETAAPPEETSVPRRSLTNPEEIALLIGRLGDSAPSEAPDAGMIPLLLVKDHDRTILAVYLEETDVIYTVDGEQYYRCADAAESLHDYLAEP